MAARFLITGGGSVTWDASNTAIWSATSGGGTGASVPGSGDTVTMDAASGGGTVTLAYDPSVTSITCGAYTGTFNTAGFTVTAGAIVGGGTATRTFTGTNSTFILTGTGTVWNFATVTNLTLNMVGSTIIANNNSASSKTLSFGAGGLQTYGDLIVEGAGTGNWTVTLSSNDFRDIKFRTTGGASITTSGGTAPVRNLDFTGFVGNWAGTTQFTITSNLTLSSTMTSSQTGAIFFVGTSGTQLLTTNGVAIGNRIDIVNPGSLLSLQDALMSSAAINITAVGGGNIRSNGFNITCTTFAFNSAQTKTIDLGGSIITCTASGTPWNAGNSGTTFTPPNLIIFNNASVGTKTFRGSALSYNDFWFTGGGTGALITDIAANTTIFDDFKVDAGLTVQGFAASTIQVNTFTVSGTAGNLVTLQSTTAGVAFNLVKAGGGVISSDYLSIQDSAASPANTWYAGANSTNVSGNTGWIFTAVPTTQGNFLMFM